MKPEVSPEVRLEWLTGFRQRDPGVLREMYKAFFPGISKHILTRGGTREDAEDVFQDAMVVLFRKLNQPEFELSSKLGTYFFAVGKRIWLKRSSQRQKRPQLSLQPEKIDLRVEIDAELEQTERNRLFREKLAQLGEDCQKVLRLFMEGVSMSEIARQMSYASDGYAKKRKFQCKKKLTELIKADPRFKELQV